MVPALAREGLALALSLAAAHGLELQEGKMMVELRVGDGNKGSAIKQLMRQSPMSGTCPIFIGDDLTDEQGFEVCRELGGAGILVGQRRVTAASYWLPDPGAVRAWLEEAVR
jgi:trehalose 6-phosphate phosphatase